MSWRNLGLPADRDKFNSVRTRPTRSDWGWRVEMQWEGARPSTVRLDRAPPDLITCGDPPLMSALRCMRAYKKQCREGRGGADLSARMKQLLFGAFPSAIASRWRWEIPTVKLL